MILQGNFSIPNKVSLDVVRNLAHSFAFVLFAYFQRLSDPFSRIKVLETWIQLAVSLTFIFLFIKIIPQLKSHSYNKWYFVFLAMLPLTAFWSEHPHITLEKSFYLITTSLFAVYLFVRFDFDNFLRIMTVGLLMILVISATLLVLFPDKVIHTGTVHVGAWKGIYYHKSGFGREMGILGLIALFSLRGSFRLLIFILCSFFVYKSQSAISLICVVGTLFYFLLENLLSKIKELRKYRMTFILIGLLAVLTLIASDFAGFLQLIGKDITLNGRLQIWLYSFFTLKDHLIFGYGFESFWQDQTLTHNLGWTVNHAHNMIIDILLDGGLLLMIPFVFLILSFVVNWRQLAEKRKLSSLIITTFMMILLISLMEETIYVPFDFKWIYISCLIFYVANPKKTANFNNYTFKIWRWS